MEQIFPQEQGKQYDIHKEIEDKVKEKLKQDSQVEERLTENKVHEAVLQTNSYTALGEDGMQGIVYKELWVEIKEILVNILNTAFRIGMFPKKWKIAVTLPIPKPAKADYSVAKAYRHISLTNVIGKIFERVICNRL